MLNDAPFHGEKEGYAKLYTVFLLVESAGACLFPWLFYGRQLARDHFRVFGTVPQPLFRNLFTDVMVLLALSTYLSLYRGMGSRIAAGGKDAVYLDTVRWRLSMMLSSLMVLVMFLSIWRA